MDEREDTWKYPQEEDINGRQMTLSNMCSVSATPYRWHEELWESTLEEKELVALQRRYDHWSRENIDSWEMSLGDGSTSVLTCTSPPNPLLGVVLAWSNTIPFETQRNLKQNRLATSWNWNGIALLGKACGNNTINNESHETPTMISHGNWLAIDLYQNRRSFFLARNLLSVDTKGRWTYMQKYSNYGQRVYALYGRQVWS